MHSGPLDWTGRPEVEVTLTSSGFVPKSIYITRGTKVTFKTTVGQPFWPASNLHPFHTIYPAFDPKRPLNPDETWSFVFDKDGHWSYHDHINPIIVGSIIVVPPGEKGGEQYDVLAPCDQKDYTGRQACWEEYLSFALDKHGLDAAFEELHTLYQTYPEFAVNCHNYAHDLGLLAYIKYGDSAPLDYKAVYCGQGFYHGFMEGLLSKHKGDVQSASAYCNRVSAAFDNGEYSILGPQCMHGIGHGYMEYLLSTRADLITRPEQLVSLAMSGCAVLPDDDARFRCGSGSFAVLKDWINLQGLSEQYKSYFSAENPYAICGSVSIEWAMRACAWEMSKEAYILNKNDAAPTFTAELTAGVQWAPQYLSSMITSTGFFIGELGVSKSDTELTAACRTIPDASAATTCIQGVVQGLMFNGDPGNEMARASSFCRSGDLNDVQRAVCAEIVVQHMDDAYGASKKNEACIIFSDLLRNDTVCS